MVILVCIFCLPQLQHRTLSALTRVSLATHGLLRVDQLIRRGVFIICAWSRSLAARALFPLQVRFSLLRETWKGQKDPPRPIEKGSSAVEGWSSNPFLQVTCLRANNSSFDKLLCAIFPEHFYFQQRTRYIFTPVAIYVLVLLLRKESHISIYVSVWSVILTWE